MATKYSYQCNLIFELKYFRPKYIWFYFLITILVFCANSLNINKWELHPIFFFFFSNFHFLLPHIVCTKPFPWPLFVCWAIDRKPDVIKNGHYSREADVSGKNKQTKRREQKTHNAKQRAFSLNLNRKWIFINIRGGYFPWPLSYGMFCNGCY